MPKKALTSLGIFSLLALPIVTLSFWAYTVLHQVIVLISVLALAWFAYYVSGHLRITF
jgi:hypothetical protein